MRLSIFTSERRSAVTDTAILVGRTGFAVIRTVASFGRNNSGFLLLICRLFLIRILFFRFEFHDLRLILFEFAFFSLNIFEDRFWVFIRTFWFDVEIDYAGL